MYLAHDDRITVRRLDLGSVTTAVWMSQKAEESLSKFVATDTKGSMFVLKLKEWAKAGFIHFEGGENYPIKHEGDGVFRVGIKASLFRLLGFYGEGFKQEFIVIDAILKKGQKRNSRDANRIKEVARVKRLRNWCKEVT